ncbi:hypothetical protein OAQ99_06265 [Candidatus Kapabacteria bacterium]|nr:hypothetical protein [Candidatus Kapabacteria bacterium]
MKKIILISSVLILHCFAFSQGDKLPGSSFKPNSSVLNKQIQIPPELKAKTNQFFNNLLDSNVAKAYEDLMRGSFLAKRDEKLKTLINQTHRAFEIYGPLQGFELVNGDEVTSSFIRVRYLGKHSRFPMRWIFTFYKSPVDGWIITNVKFDDLSELFFGDE